MEQEEEPAPVPVVAAATQPAAHRRPEKKRGLLSYAATMVLSVPHALVLLILDEARRKSGAGVHELGGALFVVLLIAAFILPGALIGWYLRGPGLRTSRWLLIAVPYWLLVAFVVKLALLTEALTLVLAGVLAVTFFLVAAMLGDHLAQRWRSTDTGERKAHRAVPHPKIGVPASLDVPFSSDGLGMMKDPRK
jgi:small-conductance mechanosensitive channel